MPDRTGEPRPGRDEPVTDLDTPLPPIGPTRAELRNIAIHACHLCDDHGYRPGHATPCDHQDHTGPAKRGIAAIRAQMGWDRPEKAPTDTTQPQP